MALQASFSSSSSSSFSNVWKYDVFLSFRGEDTRYGFTGYLYKALCDKGILTFIDDKELERGEEITPSLDKAIQESRIAILVFSKNYASSSFCLDELDKTMEYVNGKGRLVLPVFYDIDPSHVRHQTGTYGEALARHESKFKDNMEKVHNWRKALHRATSLSSWHIKYGDGYEHELIGKIVDEVSRKVKRVPLPLADYTVGLESQVKEVNLLLDVGFVNSVHMVGIHGTGGIGKTTLALAVYNSIADHFEGLCFLENVRENSNKYGLVYLQNILLSRVLGEKKIELTDIRQGISKIQHRLQQKKVLLILDDVEKQEQIQAIVGKLDWFGPGSRVIITTRDKHLLACHGVERTYEVKGLNKADALELLSWKAFKTIKVSPPSYVGVLNHVVTYACGLPLALEVIGSNLFGKNVEHWQSALDRYERIPDNKIQKILKVSYDALEDDKKSVFLDIACCFKGYKLAEVEDILCLHHGGCMKYHIGVLIEKSLIKISKFGDVTLHELIEDMGKEIVRQESPKVLEKRSRLWFHEDIVQVLEDNNQVMSETKLIHLEFPSSKEEEEAEVEWDGKTFEKMKNLKTLIIKNGHFSEAPKYLPNSLRVLEWWGYPSQYLPSNFHPKKLSIFKFPKSCFASFERVGKKFVNLKVLAVDFNECLTQIPDVSGLPNLETLSFECCENLITVHDSVGLLDKLKFLRAFCCCELRSFPPIKLPSLEELGLYGCCSLENFPELLGKMENITELDLGDTSITDLPSSFRNLTRLQKLDLGGNKFCRIPSVIFMLPKLVEIAIKEKCPLSKQVEELVIWLRSLKVEHLSLHYLSDDFFLLGLACFANVKELDLSFSSFTILPECIKECRFLWQLHVDFCSYLQEIRGVPPNLEDFSAIRCTSLTSLCCSMLLNQELHEAGNTTFILPTRRIPDWFEHRTRGVPISFWFRNKLTAIPICVAFVLPPHSHKDPVIIININERRIDLGRQFGMLMQEHTYLFDLQTIKLEDNLDEAPSGNEWNHAVLSCNSLHGKEFGIHQFKEKTNMEDIRFTDPYKRRKLDDGLSSLES